MSLGAEFTLRSTCLYFVCTVHTCWFLSGLEAIDAWLEPIFCLIVFASINPHPTRSLLKPPNGPSSPFMPAAMQNQRSHLIDRLASHPPFSTKERNNYSRQNTSVNP